jgi:hypothetical protein
MPPLLIPTLIGLGMSAEVAAVAAPIIIDVGIAGAAFGLSILFAPQVPKPDDVKTPFRQSVPNRIRILGKRRSGGAYMLYHSYRGSTIYAVIAVCDGLVSQFTRFWLHDDEVSVNPFTHVVNGIHADGANRYGDDKVHIYIRKGLPTEVSYTADALDMASRLSPDDIWTSDHRGDGIASACMVASDAGGDDQQQRFPFGIPQLSVEVVATKVFDPRRQGTGGTGSAYGSGAAGSFGGQDWADPTTWSFASNDNPILQAMWFLTAPTNQGGMALDFEESFSTVLDDVAAQADVCEEDVPLKAGGSEQRYASGALWKYSDPPGDVLAAILGACDGFCAERGDGAFELKAGKWDDDDFAIVIQDKHIISLHVTRFRPDEDEVTGVIVKYNSVAHSHTLIDAPVWPRDAYQGGEDRRIRNIEVGFCPSGTQAQRLSKRVATYEMAPVRFTAVLKMYGVLLLDRRGCTIQCTDDPALADAKVRLTRVEINLAERTVEIDGTVFDPVACDAWDPATEEGPTQPFILIPVDDAESTPVDMVAAAALIGGTVYVDLQFNPGTAPGTHDYLGEWRIADIGGGVPGSWNLQLFRAAVVEKPESDRYIVTFSGVAQSDVLDVRIAASFSRFSAIATVDTGNPSPGRVRNLATALVGADVHVSWTSPRSSNFGHARVYRATHGAGFGLAVDVSGPIAGSPNSAMSFDDLAPAAGDYDYWVTAETSADFSSLIVGPSEEVVP